MQSTTKLTSWNTFQFVHCSITAEVSHDVDLIGPCEKTLNYFIMASIKKWPTNKETLCFYSNLCHDFKLIDFDKVVPYNLEHDGLVCKFGHIILGYMMPKINMLISHNWSMIIHLIVHT